MKLRYLVASLAVASVVLMGAVGSARAADQWFILGEQTIKSVDQGVMIKSEGSRWAKDVEYKIVADAPTAVLKVEGYD
jgi:hypothetical protein